MYRIKSPLDGTVKVQVLQKAFLEQLGLIAVTSIGEEASIILPPLEQRQFTHHLYLLSPLWDTETVKYKNLIAEYGGRQPFRLMGVLGYGNHFPEGFWVKIFGTDIKRSMFKKIDRFQTMLDGNGCPPCIIEYDDEPHFVPFPD